MIIRPEQPDDVPGIRQVTAAAFTGAAHSAPPVEPGGPPGEVALVDRLRGDEGWIPDLSLVAVEEDRVVGHAVATRGYVDRSPALGLGPVSVHPAHQRAGVGSALVRAVLDRATAHGESLVVLLGDPGYYARFGFRPATDLAVESPDPVWGSLFQAIDVGGHGVPRGRFRYATPFERL